MIFSSSIMSYNLNVLFLMLFCAMCVVNLVTCDDNQPCPQKLSINITDGIVLKNGSILYENMLYPKDKYFKDSLNDSRGCVCLLKPCVRKCCPFNKVLVDRCEVPEEPIPFSPPYKPSRMDTGIEINISDHFYILDRMSCPDNHGILQQLNEFYIDEDGSIYNSNQRYSQEMACAESYLNFDNKTETYNKTDIYYVCEEKYTKKSPDWKEYMFISGFYISVPFLLLTFFAYAFLPELRNFHGKLLMNCVMALAMWCLLIGTIKLVHMRLTDDQISFGVCHTLAFSTYFFFVASFFWLNVMSFDLFLTIRVFNRRLHTHATNMEEKRRYWYYFAYAWGVSLVVCLTTMLFQFHPNLPNNIIRPGITTAKCWFDYDAEKYYVYVLLTILLMINAVLFSITSIRIININRQTSVVRAGGNRLQNSKERFTLYLKLFVVMGVSWVVEVLCYFIGYEESHFWFPLDLMNTLIGVFIFIIFLWKKKVKKLVIRRLSSSTSAPTNEMSSYRSRTTYKPSTSESHTMISSVSVSESEKY